MITHASSSLISCSIDLCRISVREVLYRHEFYFLRLLHLFFILCMLCIIFHYTHFSYSFSCDICSTYMLSVAVMGKPHHLFLFLDFCCYVVNKMCQLFPSHSVPQFTAFVFFLLITNHLKFICNNPFLPIVQYFPNKVLEIVYKLILGGVKCVRGLSQ